MCGITGVWWRRSVNSDASRAQLQAMCTALSHRGPDDAGLWIEDAVGLGHRRLSIVDLSPLGHQPMASSDERFVICFNGEVFNHDALRAELSRAGHVFRGSSDTEVMLAAIREWGLEKAVRRFIGMFAFALWDRHERALHLVRDRLGIKPLYVARSVDGDVIFGSELKSLMAHHGFSRRVSQNALSEYMRYGYVPAPLTMFADAMKLLPGHIMTLSDQHASLTSYAYWTLEAVASEGAKSRLGSDERAIEIELDELLRDAVRLRMLADVPLGAFLSGGIDSSLVVALMQAQTGQAVKTFTIGFEEARFDESAYARDIANHLGTEHTEQRVTAAEAQAVIPQLPIMFDEPMADASQIPTYLVSALARSRVTVALSGDGGDELFGGYARYGTASRGWARLKALPKPFGYAGEALLRGMAGLPMPAATGRRLRRMAAVVKAHSFPELYRQFVVTAPKSERLLFQQDAQHDCLLSLMARMPHRSDREQMMFVDTAMYLPDDLLTKLDRTSMAVGLEGRVPLLDHRVVEFAWRLEPTQRQNKRLLRAVLGRYVPRSLYERPKMGFEVPIGTWLRGPLREWADDLLDPHAVRTGGLLDSKTVSQAWRAHLDGSGDEPHLIWSTLALEAWRRHWNAHV